ncbi:sensor histidine kinase [Desulfovibrio inopinatus]|uniref:sensor histidine kinase n=1 Tax=Desulfovibrio inopinatus TaxID=102109 RepID=UPI000421D3FA|nr:PAS domain-containing sensor histidine kinase [Desulfovibrio inopinatus]
MTYDTLIHTVFDKIPIGIIVMCTDGGVHTINDAMAKRLGLHMAAKQALSGELQERVPDLWNIIVSIAVSTDRSRSFIYMHQPDPLSGSQFDEKNYILFNSVEFYSFESTFIIFTAEDITEFYRQHDRERAILSSMHRLQKERSESLIQLARSVSHQVRNPIMAIAGFSRLLMENKQISDKDRERLRAIFEESARLETIVRAMSGYASLQHGIREHISTEHIVSQSELLVREKARVAGISSTFQVMSKGKEAGFWGEPALIMAAVDEVIQNAVDFATAEHVDLRLEVCPDSAGWSLSFIDAGQGILPTDMPYVFDPFFSTKPQGVGMGLTRAKRALTENQGEIAVESEPHNWTRVCLYLPQRQSKRGDEEPRRPVEA